MLDGQQRQPQHRVLGALDEGHGNAPAHLARVVKPEPLMGEMAAPVDHELGTEHAAESHERLARDLAAVIPALQHAKVKERASGLPTWTPDGRHILGPAPSIEGYYVLAGCNESGVTHGPGLARLAAELIATGGTDADISAYRVDRFGPLTDAALQAAAESQYLARHPPAAGQAPEPFGITIPRSSR